MSYNLEFDPRALKEWRKLGEDVRLQFKKKLEQVLQHPRNDKNRLRELPDCYKIKLRASGYRLVYQVRDQTITVFVVAVGKRERSAAYDAADKRL